MSLSPHVFDFLRLFRTLFCHHDVHDFLLLDVGVVWCFKFNCDVPSVGRALTWYDSASLFLYSNARPIVLDVSWVTSEAFSPLLVEI